MLSRALIALTLGSLCALASAQKQTMNVFFFGEKAGTSTYELKADGTWSSSVDASVAGTKIAFKMTGKLVKNKVTQYRLDGVTNGKKILMTVENGRAKVVIDGKEAANTEVKGLPAAAMGNFLPQILHSALAGYDRVKGGEQTLDLLLLDNGAVLKAKLEHKGVFKAGSKVYEDWTIQVANVNCRIIEDAKVGRVIGMDVPTQQYQQVAVGYEGLFVDPTTLDKSLSQPDLKAKVEKGIKTPMRDGVNLVVDIARPDDDAKHPAILIRTPYGRTAQFTAMKPEWWAKRGYVAICQDCRGRDDSEGTWDPFVNEKNDGYDTIDWISKQPWCDGNVGMIGGSYSGLVQWQAAVMKHPALKCIVPQVSPPDAFFNIPYDHGSFFLFGDLWWSEIVRNKKTDMSKAADRAKDWSKFATLPLTQVDNALLGADIPWYDRWLARDKASDWADWNYQDQLASIDLPALHISGWFDGDGIGTKTNWAALAAAKKPNQYLIYGAWPHAFNTTTKIGDLDFGPDAVIELDSVYLRWFDTWLKGKNVKLAEKLPKVQVFVTGVNEWRFLDGWPDSRSTEKTLYFSSTGPANGDSSMGRLIDSPPGAEEPDHYVYNPADVTVPPSLAKTKDPDEAEVKLEIDPHDEDLLVYKTDPLKEPVDMGGPIAVDLYFSSSAVDTDFIASIFDVDEKGTMRPIGISGRIRARYLSGWSNPTPLEPGKVYKAVIEPWDSAHRFDKGHRIAVVVDSGDWPIYARNLGTMEPIGTGTKMVAQSQTVYHDGARPSALRFMVLPKK